MNRTWLITKECSFRQHYNLSKTQLGSDFKRYTHLTRISLKQMKAKNPGLKSLVRNPCYLYPVRFNNNYRNKTTTTITASGVYSKMSNHTWRSQYACFSFLSCVVFLILKCTSVLSCVARRENRWVNIGWFKNNCNTENQANRRSDKSTCSFSRH